MRKKYIFGKKLYISVLTSILVLLTTVATTFAWVGVFANSTFESFDFNIRANELVEYGIEISATGQEGTFSDEISSIEVKTQILLNWGFTQKDLTDYGVENLFNAITLEQCTTVPNIVDGKMTSLNQFTNLVGENSTSLFKFDIYVSPTQYYDSGSYSDYKLDVFLGQGLISGTTKFRKLLHPFVYPESFINPLENLSLPDGISPLIHSTSITQARVNSKSVCRVGFEKYNVVDRGHPELYASSSPVSSIIYSGDSYNYPTYNSDKDEYEFGGIFEDELNVAVGYYNSTEWRYSREGIKTVSITDPSAQVYGNEVYAIRGVNGTHPDQLFNSTTNHLIDSSNSLEQIGIGQMMKLTVYFWLEGWDADCFNVIGNSPVTIAITMSIKNEDDF